MSDLQFNYQQPALFASERFIEAADTTWTTAISVHTPHLTETVQMATGTRGQLREIGAVTLQLGRELSFPRTKLYPVDPNQPLALATANDPLRMSQIRIAARLQELKLLRLRTSEFSEEDLLRTTYMAALRKPARRFASGSGAAIGLAAYVIESGIRSDPSLPRVAAYTAGGLALGAIYAPLLMRAKYRLDRPSLDGRTPLRLHHL